MCDWHSCCYRSAHAQRAIRDARVCVDSVGGFTDGPEVDEALFDIGRHEFDMNLIADIQANGALHQLALHRRLEDLHPGACCSPGANCCSGTPRAMRGATVVPRCRSVRGGSAPAIARRGNSLQWAAVPN